MIVSEYLADPDAYALFDEHLMVIDRVSDPVMDRLQDEAPIYASEYFADPEAYLWENGESRLAWVLSPKPWWA